MANEKEITIKAVKKADDRVSIMDLGGDWYSGWKNSCTEDTWAALNRMEAGQHADIQWEVNKKGFKNLTGFIPVLRGDAPPAQPKGDTAPQPSAASEKDDKISKLALLKAGAEIVSAMIGSPSKLDAQDFDELLVDPAGRAVVFAKRLYKSLNDGDWK